MSDTTVGLCRLTVRSPERSFDIGVPVDVPVADLLPVLVDYAGEDLHEQGLDQGGWAVQRLGQPPLDDEGTPRTLELRDGETLYLRPRHETLPEVAYDDLVDGVGEALRKRPDSWRPELTRRLLLGFAATALTVGLIVLALPGPTVLRAVISAGLALLLVACSGAASRAVGDASGGAVLGIMAVPYMALAGALVPSGGHAEVLLGARLLAAGATGAGASVLALAAVAACAPLFFGALTVSLFIAVGGAGVVAGLPVSHAAGIVVLCVLICGGLVPGLGFRMSGLRLPVLPANADQLQEGITPHPADRIATRAVLADSYMTGLYAALGLVAAACLTALLTAPGTDDWPPLACACVLSLLLLLHSRHFGSLWQRLSMVLPGAYGLALAAALGATGLALPARLGLTAGLLAAAAVAAIAAWTVPGRRLVPYWGRIGDLLHTTTAVVLVPLTILVAGIYQQLRAIKG
ncbi:type VII secretion integral membrane protein EccD [Streptomyces pinistramenti]|uniref:type VII secretion integral membrane protein EccD n=1 Tax=Streptomyces pinistramenti TaxID=2884812 RepID=UPI001D07EEA2|nr:type VII secretion integral membrane protein EccD [Streptomyces pinistramenti]MCB5906104.1 type VII secretion integral membrane protein EccD [Streptomyces pinistramenti]